MHPFCFSHLIHPHLSTDKNIDSDDYILRRATTSSKDQIGGGQGVMMDDGNDEEWEREW
jgi:hypothetical protein